MGTAVALLRSHLIPAGLKTGLLAVPSTIQPVHCRVNGIPVSISELDNGKWAVPLFGYQTPQQIDVVFRGTFDPSTTHSLAASQFGIKLEDAVTVQSLWSVNGPLPTQPAPDRPGIAQLSPATYQTRHIEAVKALQKL